MKRSWGFALVIGLILMAMASGAAAGGSPLLAFVNSSGQLVVSSADGGYRWIVTNPGETLVGNTAWAGGTIVFAVYDGGEISARAGDANAQNVYEIGRGAGYSVTIGGFTNGNAVIAFDDRIGLYSLVGNGGGALGVNGTITENATDGGAIFARANDGSYGVIARDGSTYTPLGFANDPNAPFVNLWSGSLVAYADYGIGSPLTVTDANTGESVMLSSDGSIPLIPLAWAGSTLIYRGTGGVIRAADLSCLNCGNPLENGVDLLAGSATDVQTDGRWVYFIDGELIGAVDLGCVNRGDCLNSAQIIGLQAAPETSFSVNGGVLIYTAYLGNPYDLASREVRAFDVSCLGGGECQPAGSYGGATAGALSSDGRAVVMQDANGGLGAWNWRGGSAALLSDGGDLLHARWAS